MILAGIDEAGLGPVIGPLVTASAALSTPDGWAPGDPWQFLESSVATKKCKADTRPAVCDSKILYSSSGLAEVELTVGIFSLLCGKQHPLGESGGIGEVHVCYSGSLTPFPVHTEDSTIREMAAGIKRDLKRLGAAMVHFEALPLYEPVYNHRFSQGLNKNQVLLMETGAHLRRLVDTYRKHNMLIVVDKQGGRNEYLPFLTSLFPGIWLDEVSCGAEESIYRLRRRGGTVEIRFQAKADRLSFPTALASLAAKYVRERAMAELNAWFCREICDLKPTAGYPGDVRRWLDAVARTGRTDLGMEFLVRCK